MIHSVPTITKEQYERLEKLANTKEPGANINKQKPIFGDKLSSFLKEHIAEGSTNNTNSDANFYKLVERFA